MEPVNETHAGQDGVHGVSDDNTPVNPQVSAGVRTIGDLIDQRFSRRSMLKGIFGSAAIVGLATGLPSLAVRPARAATSSFAFEEIEHGVDEKHHVAKGYATTVLIRWGDPVVAGAPVFDPTNQTADKQEKQFGYNNDYIGFAPLPAGSSSAERGLLCINHEYTNEELMFPSVGRQEQPLAKGGKSFFNMTEALVDIEMAAHGGTVIEVRREGGTWRYVQDSPYNRRISARSTQIRMSGPAAGSDRLKTTFDRDGIRVIGMLNNCSGGMTPWGTWLSGEENFHSYFGGHLAETHPESQNHKRYGVPGGSYAWSLYKPRFDVAQEPHEPNRFGWVVEIDPYDPTSVPVKRTALGRFKHEGAETVVNRDGRLVVYMGDDQAFEYVYKFVTAGTFNPGDPKANTALLDEGTLYVAQFQDEGTLNWLPLVHGEGPLTAANGFRTQADVLIETRRAADLLGATPMDRPEDVQPNVKTGKVYVMLTNNKEREPDQMDAANPRASNTFGHIIEIIEPEMNYAATQSRWEILVRCGDPTKPDIGAMWHPETSAHGWFASPDMCQVDHQGRVWIGSDQGSNWSKSGTADGVWALETEGEQRGTGKMFFRCPVGAELCGPCFTPDDTTLFVAVQHPAADGTKAFEGFMRHSTFEDPATRWPDFDPNLPPRPSVVAITKENGGVIGS